MAQRAVRQCAVGFLLAAAMAVAAAGARAADDQPGKLKLRPQTQSQSQTKTTNSGPEAAVQRMDQNGDGRISAAEFRGPPQLFSAIDADGDGFVTAAEIAAAQQRSTGKQPPGDGAAATGPLAAWYRNLPVILTHTHFNVVTERSRNPTLDWHGAEVDALRLMDENGIRAAIIMPTPTVQGRSLGDTTLQGLLRIAQKHPDRFRVSGGGATLNVTINATPADRVGDSERRAFAARAEQIAAAGAVGFGEFAALHFSLFSGHPFEETQPDHPLFLLAADIAAKHDMPLDLHVEPVAQDWTVSPWLHKLSGENPDRVRENLTALERLLAHNPQAKIIWVHVGVDSTGFRTVALTRRMLQAHANLYLSISGFQVATDNWFINPKLGLNPEWRALILDFPDRFMIGSDTFFQPQRTWHSFQQPLPMATLAVRTPVLPPAVARKVAYENAQRIFHIDLIGPEAYPLPAGATEHAAATPAPAESGEMVGPRGLTARQMIANNDRDGDGRLAATEFHVPPPLFQRLDGDGDGFVTAAEFEAFWRTLKKN